MKVVLDTNVLVSAFLFGGRPLDLLDLANVGIVQVHTSEKALAELQKVLSRDKFRGRLRSLGLTAAKIVALYRDLATVVEVSYPANICPDSGDDEFISIAISGRVDVIVTGDRDLLSCSGNSPIPIITVAESLLAIKDLLVDGSH